MRTATCQKCQRVIVLGPLGPIAKFCKECKKADRLLGRNVVDATCAGCGECFKTTPGAVEKGRRFCSIQCVGLSNTGQHRGGARHICQCCGKKFKRKGGKDRGMFCSQDCCWIEKRRRSAEKQERLATQKASAEERRRVERQREKERKQQRYLDSRKCKHCNCKMPEETAGTWARFCSDECRHAAADVSREKARLKNKGRGSQSHETRARRRGLPLIYSITLNKVASMDGFQCQLCGEETLPCFVRGDHRSPTIDHVVPLGNPANMMHGHTWDNVQLACWECNCRKREHVECDSLLWSTNPRELAKRIRRERGFFFVKAGGASPGNAVVRTKAPRESRANISQILKNPEATDGTPRATA